VKLNMPNGSDRYDGNTCEHSHIVCERCGRVFDFEFAPDEIRSRVLSETGAVVTGCRLIIYGVCKLCSIQSKEEFTEEEFENA
jgi:Fur family peroxide stress response transcriptional regulator